jgi:hypothetical protein
MCRDEEVKMVKVWFNRLAADFYDEGIQKPVTLYSLTQLSPS